MVVRSKDEIPLVSPEDLTVRYVLRDFTKDKLLHEDFFRPEDLARLPNAFVIYGKLPLLVVMSPEGIVLRHFSPVADIEADIRSLLPADLFGHLESSQVLATHIKLDSLKAKLIQLSCRQFDPLVWTDIHLLLELIALDP